jgi:hypothetical protein
MSRKIPAAIGTALAMLARRKRLKSTIVKPPTMTRPSTRYVTVRTVSAEPETTLGALAELIERECELSLFCHARTGEDVTVHRRDDDDEIVLLYPPGSPLSEEHELVIPVPCRYAEPVALAAVRSELDVLNHRFAYFIDAGDHRGKVLYRSSSCGLITRRY